MTDKETLTAEQLAKRVVCEIWETYCPMQTRTAEAIQRLISEAINQHTSSLQSQLTDKDKEIERLSKLLKQTEQSSGREIYERGTRAIKAEKRAEQAETKVAGLVEVLEKADEFITQHLEAEEQASVAGINFAWRESAAQTIINVGQIVEQALTDAQPLVRERDKRIIQECIDDIEDMDRSSVMPEYWHKGVKDSIACLKNKQGGV